MNKIVFLSVCLISFNAAWSSSPSAASSSSTVAAATSATPEKERGIVITIICKANPPSTIFEAHETNSVDGTTKGVTGTLKKFTQHFWTPHPEDFPHLTSIAKKATERDEYLFEVLIGTHFDYQATTIQNGTLLHTQEKVDPVISEAINRLHESLKQGRVNESRRWVQTPIPQDVDLQKFLEGNSFSIWRVHYNPQIPKSHSFDLAVPCRDYLDALRTKPVAAKDAEKK